MRKLTDETGDLHSLTDAAEALPKVEDELSHNVAGLREDVAGLRDEMAPLNREASGLRGDIGELRDKIPGL